MDIDTTLKGQDLSLENAQRIVNEIAEIQIDDGVSLIITDVETIMDEMEYPGIRFHLDAIFEKMITPIKIDVSTGDVITPRAIEYNYKLIGRREGEMSASTWNSGAGIERQPPNFRYSNRLTRSIIHNSSK